MTKGIDNRFGGPWYIPGICPDCGEDRVPTGNLIVELDDEGHHVKVDRSQVHIVCGCGVDMPVDPARVARIDKETGEVVVTKVESSE